MCLMGFMVKMLFCLFTYYMIFQDKKQEAKMFFF